MTNYLPNRAERRAVHKRRVTETRRALREKARTLALAKRFGNKRLVRELTAE